MNFKLQFTHTANDNYKKLASDKRKAGVLKAVRKALGYMQTNLRHPGLKTHKYDAIKGENGEEVFEAYAQNQTSGAYRIFWHYGPSKDEITIIAITPHP